MIQAPVADAEVVRLVRSYLGNDQLQLSGITWAPVSHAVVNSATGGLYRVSGEAAAAGQTQPWSLILKVILASPKSPDDPAHWNYWKREALAYQSEIPYALAPALTAPRLAGVLTVADALYVFMEDVQAEALTLAEDAALAERLGQWGALPLRAPWLSPAYLRGILRTGAMIMQMVDEAGVWDFPHIAREFPPSLVGRVRLLLRSAGPLLDRLDAMPRVLCHCDAHRGNVLRRGGDFVLLDWSTVGLGAPGEDVGHLFSSNLLVGAVAPARAGEVAEALVAGYHRGLAAGGLCSTEQDVQTGFTITVALRSFGFALPLILRAGSDPHNQQAVAYAPVLGAAVRALAPWLDGAVDLL